MNHILKFSNSLHHKGYCHSTIRCYKNAVALFLKETKFRPGDISEKEIESYFLHEVNRRKISPAYQKHLLFALKLFFKEVFNRHLKLKHLFPKNCKIKLPSILSQCEVKLILDSCINIKHKAILSIIYSAGLKLNEVVNLRLSDIDVEKMIINIKEINGNKYRHVPLSDKLNDILTEYYKIYKPKVWLFGGLKGNKCSKRSVQLIFDKSILISKIKKRATIQTLRHSYAAHLVESGTDIRIIQELLGHNCIRSTKIYTNITAVIKSNVKSPLDTLLMISFAINMFANLFHSLIEEII
jgi:integrase/recombinase XerD